MHWLRDPETDEYNFSRTLENIPQPDQFAFDRLPGFVPSSQDEALIAYARKNKCKYIGSTSSLTGILAQIYLLLSEEKLVNLENLSEDFATAVSCMFMCELPTILIRGLSLGSSHLGNGFPYPLSFDIEMASIQQT